MITCVKNEASVNEDKEGEVNVCKAIFDIREEGKEEGKIAGKIAGKILATISIGRKHHFTDNEILDDLQSELGITLKAAQGYLYDYKKLKVNPVKKDKLKLAAVQMKCEYDLGKNIVKADELVRQAAAKGAKIILLPELFEHRYFCQECKYEYLDYAKPIEENDAVRHFRRVAKELSVVLPISFYEYDGHIRCNSVAVIDVDGSILGVYRKTHIPDYSISHEKWYLSPGNTGFRVFDTSYARIGIASGWDLWFPETVRCLALAGAEVICFPMAMGSDPYFGVNSSGRWCWTMQGQAAMNMVPIVTANRFGREMILPEEGSDDLGSEILFYGSSFITDVYGRILTQASMGGEEVVIAELDMKQAMEDRQSWEFFHDRRPECYKAITEVF